MAARHGGRTVCLTGPESTGKTTLTVELARRLGASWVPEVARDHLAGRSAYDRGDLDEIARRQLSLERERRTATRGLLLCDTDALVLRIWWREKLGPPPTWLASPGAVPPPRAYLLLAPDVPWEPDPLRENPTDRTRLFELHVREIESTGHPYRVVHGLGETRLANALDALATLDDDLAPPRRA